jgi:hypothetical protein
MSKLQASRLVSTRDAVIADLLFATGDLLTV